MSAPSLEAEPTTSTKSVQAPNINSSSLKDMFKVISADHDGAQWGRIRRRHNNGHHKNCIQTHEAKWPLEFIGGKYDCAGEAQQQL
jgi:hypothetical protein